MIKALILASFCLCALDGKFYLIETEKGKKARGRSKPIEYDYNNDYDNNGGLNSKTNNDYAFKNTGEISGDARQNNHGCAEFDFDNSAKIKGDAEQNNLADCGKGASKSAKPAVEETTEEPTTTTTTTTTAKVTTATPKDPCSSSCTPVTLSIECKSPWIKTPHGCYIMPPTGARTGTYKGCRSDRMTKKVYQWNLSPKEEIPKGSCLWGEFEGSKEPTYDASGKSNNCLQIFSKVGTKFNDYPCDKRHWHGTKFRA